MLQIDHLPGEPEDVSQVVTLAILQNHAERIHRSVVFGRNNISNNKHYYWERDFPVNFQSRKTGTQTIIRLEFLLSENEISEFKDEIKSNLNGTLPIVVKIGKDNNPIIEVSKKGIGSKTLNSKSSLLLG